MKKIYDLIEKISKDPFWKWPAGVIVFIFYCYCFVLLIEAFGLLKKFLSYIELPNLFNDLLSVFFSWFFKAKIFWSLVLLIFIIYLFAKIIKILKNRKYHKDKLISFLKDRKKDIIFLIFLILILLILVIKELSSPEI